MLAIVQSAWERQVDNCDVCCVCACWVDCGFYTWAMQDPEAIWHIWPEEHWEFEKHWVFPMQRPLMQVTGLAQSELLIHPLGLHTNGVTSKLQIPFGKHWWWPIQLCPVEVDCPFWVFWLLCVFWFFWVFWLLWVFWVFWPLWVLEVDVPVRQLPHKSQIPPFWQSELDKHWTHLLVVSLRMSCILGSERMKL